jgi:hypothetical protein
LAPRDDSSRHKYVADCERDLGIRAIAPQKKAEYGNVILRYDVLETLKYGAQGPRDRGQSSSRKKVNSGLRPGYAPGTDPRSVGAGWGEMLNCSRSYSIRKPGEPLRGSHGNQSPRKSLKDGDRSLWSLSGDPERNLRPAGEDLFEIGLYIRSGRHQTAGPGQRAGSTRF